MEASSRGHLNIVKYLVDHGADINYSRNIRFMTKFTALHVASKHGHLPIVEYLINTGAHINVFGKSALTLAIMYK